MSNDKIIITLQIPKEMHNELLAEANKSTLSLSAYIRTLLLNRNEQKRENK